MLIGRAGESCCMRSRVSEFTRYSVSIPSVTRKISIPVRLMSATDRLIRDTRHSTAISAAVPDSPHPNCA